MGRLTVIDTHGQALLTGEPLPGRASARRRRSVLLLAALVLLLALAALMSLARLPYAIVRPGPIANTLGTTEDGKPLIEVAGRTYPVSGALDFTTVVVHGGPNYPVNAWRVLASLFDRTAQILPEEVMFPPGTTGEQVREQNAAEMADSQQEAIAVALAAAGQPVAQVVSVSSVQPDAPSGAVLKAGDVLLAVGGEPATSAAAVRSAVQAHRPGDTLEVRVRRDGSEEVLAVRTGEREGRTVLGVLLGVRFDFPTKVTVNAGDVGGPSAGLMFALGIYDKITPGQLTGGLSIAGTGTIDSDGAVSEIGFIRQKLVAARDGGAGWFLAPAANCGEVVGHVPEGLRVVRVATFAEARSAVQDIAAGTAGDLPSCSDRSAAAG